MIDFDAIRARDAEDVSTLPMLKTLAVAVDDPELRNAIHMIEDRRTLLAAYDALAAAARKVTCRRCSGSGVVFVVKYIDVTDEYRFREPCPECADLKQLLEEP